MDGALMGGFGQTSPTTVPPKLPGNSKLVSCIWGDESVLIYPSEGGGGGVSGLVVIVLRFFLSCSKPMCVA